MKTKLYSSPFHPRPQLRRKDWTSLDGQWKFAFDDDANAEFPDQILNWRSIQVPFAPESLASGIGDTGFHRCCWYEREFDLKPGEGRVILHFEAADYETRVWINGHYAGSHVGGHTRFSLDITRFLRADAPQRVTVRAYDDPFDLAKPRGKQDWQLNPHSIWYPRTTGIWGSVWLENVPTTYLSRIRWTPHLERWELFLAAFINGEERTGLDLRVKLWTDDQLFADDTYRVIGGEVHRSIAFSDPGIDDYRNELLWSPEKPTLIHAELELSKDGNVIDRVESYTALRSIAIHRDRFMFNGRPYYLKLVLDQGFTGGGFGGSVVILCEKGRANDIAPKLCADYKIRFSIDPSVLVPVGVCTHLS